MTGALDLLVWATVLPVIVVLVIAARHDRADAEHERAREDAASANGGADDAPPAAPGSHG